MKTDEVSGTNADPKTDAPIVGEMTTITELIEKNTKSVTNPETTNTYRIRRLTPIDFLSTIGGLPLGDLMGDMKDYEGLSDAATVSLLEKRIEARESSGDTGDLYCLIISRGVTSINISLDLPTNAASGVLNVADVPAEDQKFLSDSIVDFTGMDLPGWGVNLKRFR